MAASLSNKYSFGVEHVAVVEHEVDVVLGQFTHVRTTTEVGDEMVGSFGRNQFDIDALEFGDLQCQE